MRLIIAVLFAVLASGSLHAAEGERRIMANIEHNIELPPKASPISRYRRHYAWLDPGKTVLAVYELGGRPMRLWLPPEEMPILLDGACSVVTFTYDVIHKRAIDLRCN